MILPSVSVRTVSIGFSFFLSVIQPSFSADITGSDEGGVSSGGGLGVVCFTDRTIPIQIRSNGGYLSDQFLEKIDSIEALDLIDARLPRGYDAEYTPKVIQPTEMTDNILIYEKEIEMRMNYAVPHLAGLLASARNSLYVHNILHQPFGLKPVKDAAWAGQIDEQRCVVATLALQYFKKDALVIQLDSRLFNHPKHTALSRGVLLLHELLYSQARRRGHKNSENTRQLLAYLITDHGDQVTIADLMRLTEDLGFATDESGQSVPLLSYHEALFQRAASRLVDFLHSQVVLDNGVSATNLLVRCSLAFGGVPFGKRAPQGTLQCREWIKAEFEAGRVPESAKKGAQRIAEEIDALFARGSDETYSRAFEFAKAVDQEFETVFYATDDELDSLKSLWKEYVELVTTPSFWNKDSKERLQGHSTIMARVKTAVGLDRRMRVARLLIIPATAGDSAPEEPSLKEHSVPPVLP